MTISKVHQNKVWLQEALKISGDPDSEKGLACGNLPGSNDTLIIMKTGSTELEAKLPVHLYTTLQCISHGLVFSDAKCTYHNESIIDALEAVSSEIKDNHPDFTLYRRLRRNALTADETHGILSGDLKESWTGHQENPGWKLDKWKFLPMINRTFSEYPTMKWYVFIEADTYVLLSSLLQHLSKLDYTQPYYSGVRVYINDVVFAHGGSGFIVSQPAMARVVDHFTKHQSEFENFTADHWAGDCVLGKAFSEVGVRLTDAWPLIQGDYPGIVPYFGPDGRPMPPVNKRIWCSNTITYHHMQPDMVENMWHFEQQWLTRDSEPLQHRDVFKEYILKRMETPCEDWDDESSSSVGVAADIDTCRTWCEKDLRCLQYSIDSESQCRHYHLPRLGKPVQGARSGWMNDRIRRELAAPQPCEGYS